MLEKLFRSKWTNQDGLGALVISPTRELVSVCLLSEDFSLLLLDHPLNVTAFCALSVLCVMQAVQIFEVLRKAGAKHSFSAGLIIGGKDLKSEQERLSQMNILICTPGRLLQHMDQTPLFDTYNLQICSARRGRQTLRHGI